MWPKRIPATRADISQGKAGTHDMLGRHTIRRLLLNVAVVGVLAMMVSISLQAQQPAPQLPEPSKTDPNALGLMQGFPPPAEKTVRFADGSAWKFPMTRWSFSHMRELLPTAAV